MLVYGRQRALCSMTKESLVTEVGWIRECVTFSNSCCLVAKSCPTLCHTSLFCLWDFPGKNTGMSCHFLLQGIFPTQGSNPSLLHWQEDSLPPSHQGSSQYWIFISLFFSRNDSPSSQAIYQQNANISLSFLRQESDRKADLYKGGFNFFSVYTLYRKPREGLECFLWLRII